MGLLKAINCFFFFLIWGGDREMLWGKEGRGSYGSNRTQSGKFMDVGAIPRPHYNINLQFSKPGSINKHPETFLIESTTSFDIYSTQWTP